MTRTAMDFPDHPFWDSSLRVHGADGVAGACLDLQDAHQLDVNIVLYCCWIGATGRGALDTGEAEAITKAVAEWHGEIVRGVRAVRQRLKDGLALAPLELSEPLRRRIARIEVELEHVEQLMLAAVIDRPEDTTAPAERRAADRAAIATIVAASVPGLDAGRLNAICAEL